MDGELVGWSYEKGFEQVEFSDDYTTLELGVKSGDKLTVYYPGLKIGGEVVVRPQVYLPKKTVV